MNARAFLSDFLALTAMFSVIYLWAVLGAAI